MDDFIDKLLYYVHEYSDSTLGVFIFNYCWEIAAVLVMYVIMRSTFPKKSDPTMYKSKRKKLFGFIIE